MQRAIRTGEPQFIPDVQAEAESMAHDAEHAQAIHELGNESGHRRPADRARADLRRDHVRHRPAAAAVHRVRLRARDRARPARVRRTRQRAPASRGGSARACGRRRSSSSTTASSSSTATGSSASGTPPPRQDLPRQAGEGDRPPRRRADRRLGDRGARITAATEPTRRHEPRADDSRRRPGQRALALDLGGALPRRHGLRLPRHDRGARGRAVEERLRLDDLARAAHAARRDLRRGSHAAAKRRAPRGVAAHRAARRHLERSRPPRAHRQRHPLGEPARLRPDGRRDRELRRGASSRRA